MAHRPDLVKCGSAFDFSVFRHSKTTFEMTGTPAASEEGMFHILWSIIVGFIVGLIARALMPGIQSMGFIETTLIGIVGSVVGGLIARIFSKPADGSYFHPAGFFLSIIGAVIVLAIMLHFSTPA